MTNLPIDEPQFHSVGSEGEGGLISGGEITVLDSDSLPRSAVLPNWVQENQDCRRCGGPQIVVFAWEVEGGLMGCCLGCGEERFLPFTRTIGEVA